LRRDLGKRYPIEFVSSSGARNTYRIDTDSKWLSALMERIAYMGGTVISEEEP